LIKYFGHLWGVILSAADPSRPLHASAVNLPELESVMMSTNDQTHPIGLGAEPRVFKKPSHVERSVVRPDVQPDEAVRRMTKRPVAEAPVLREKRYPPKLVQQRNDVRVFDSQAGHLAPNF